MLQPLRYSFLMNWSASGQFFALRFSASHSNFFPTRIATLPRSTNSVNGPAWSKLDIPLPSPLQARIHSLWWPGERGRVGLGFSMSLNFSFGSQTDLPP